LSLNSSYSELQTKFTENTKRNIKKAEKNITYINDDISIKAFLSLKKENNINNIENHHFIKLEKLMSMLIEKKHANILGVASENKLIGAALFVTFKHRIIYLFSASGTKGKNQRAMFAIVNAIIKENTEKNMVLDFEGSMIEGVARFFKGFGASPETYYRIKKSRIPFLK